MTQNKSKFLNDADDILGKDSEIVFPEYRDLTKKNIFITGGGSGIGAYFVAAFTLQGARVAFVSLSEAGANSLCGRVAERCDGRTPIYYPCDIRDINKLGDCMNDFQAKYGPIDVLINNAARDTRHDVGSYSVEEWDDAQNTNLRPHYFTSQFAVDGMRKAGGSIINVGSNSSILGLAGYPAYVASKAAIQGLSKALARELGPDNIRVNTLIPGWVMTKRQEELWVTEDSLSQCLASQSLKKTISGSDVAQVALFLGSEASSMITGQSIIIDGGRV